MLLHKKSLYAPPEDRKTYGLFREAGVIVEYVKKHVAGQQTCSWCVDGARPHMRDKVKENCQANGGAETFFHPFGGNGEAMRFALNSPLSLGFSDRDNPDIWGMAKTKEILEALGIAENVGIVVRQHRLVHHWPCKAALGRGLSFARALDLVIRGKVRIKHQIPGLEVGMDLFCDWGHDDHTFDLIKKGAYLELIENDPRFTRTYDEWCAYKAEVEQLPALRNKFE